MLAFRALDPSAARGADSFDADCGGIALQFTRKAAAEVTEVKVSGSRVRNLHHTRVALPKT